MKPCLANTSNANERTVYFDLRDTTGLAPANGEDGGQPQISINGAAWTDEGIGTLTLIGHGRYFATVTQAAVSEAGRQIETRYKSDQTAECPGDTLWTVAFNPLTLAPAIGNGGFVVTVTVQDEDEQPIEGAIARLELGITSIVQVTDADGLAVFAVGAGDWRLATSKAGYSATPQTVTVSGNLAQSVTMEAVAFVPPSPSDPENFGTVFGSIATLAGAPASARKITFTLVVPNGGLAASAPVFVPENVEVTAGEDGTFSAVLARTDVLLPEGCEYSVRIGGRNFGKNLTVDGTAKDLSSILSP